MDTECEEVALLLITVVALMVAYIISPIEIG